MDIARLRRGELIAGISGLALFIIMFLSWFGAPNTVDTAIGEVDIEGFTGVDTTANAWQSFDFIDIILLITVIVAVGLAIATAAARTVALPVAASAITAGLGIISTLLVLYRIIDPPDDAGREFGVYLGLIASAGVALGGWLAMQEEGATFAGAAEQARARASGGRSQPPPPPPGGTAGGPPPGGTSGAPPAGGTTGEPPPSGTPPSTPPPSRGP